MGKKCAETGPHSQQTNSDGNFLSTKFKSRARGCSQTTEVIK